MMTALLRSLLIAGIVATTSSFALAQPAPSPSPVPQKALADLRHGPVAQSISSQGTDLQFELAFLLHRLNVANYIDPATPRQSVSLALQNVDDRTALQNLMQFNGLSSCVLNGVAIVAPLPVLANKYNCIYLPTTMIPLGPGDEPEQVVNRLNLVVPPGTLVWADPAQHAIMVQGTASATSRVRTFLQGSPSNPQLVGCATVGASENLCNLGTMQTATVRLRYTTDTNTLMRRLSLLAPATAPNTMAASPETGSIVIYGQPAYVAQAAALIGSLDQPTAQVMYDVSFIEIEPRSFQENRGVLFGGNSVQGQAQAGNGSTVYSFVNKFVPVNLTINALESNGKARVLERATITTLNNVPGSTGYVTHIPIVIPDPLTGIGTFRTIDAGVKLSVTPSMGSAEIATNIKTSYSNQDGVGQGGYPQVTERSVDSSAITTPDDVILISGLYADTSQSNIQGLPPLNHIPIFGKIFNNKQASELHDEVVILLQPHTVLGGNTHNLPVQFPSIAPGDLSHGIAPNLAPGP